MFSRTLYFTNLTLLTAVGPAGESARVSRGRIIAINEPPDRRDRIIDGQGGLMIPGLINAHDHLEMNTFARLKYRDRYTHARQWVEEIEARFDTDPAITGPRRQPLEDRLLVGTLKNILSGVTTACHHNPLYRFLRRNKFLRVVKDYGFSHSLFRGDDPRVGYRRTRPGHPWLIHLAEGVDAEAAAEFDRLDRMGLVWENTVLIHGVGLTARQRQALIERGGGLVWCPGSNLFLFGQTATVQELAAAGKLALGSDSRLSGEFDMLAELRVASGLGQLSPRELFRLVTVDAARLLRLQSGGRGQLAVGLPADLLILSPPIPPDPVERLFSATRSDITLVMVGGRPVIGSPEMQPVFEAARTRWVEARLDGASKLLVKRLADRLRYTSVSEPGLSFCR